MTQSTTTSAPANGAVTGTPTTAPSTPASAGSSAPQEPLSSLPARLAGRPRRIFTEDERAAIMRQCCTNSEKPDESATPDELADFIGFCERVQLDPLARQVHFLKRGKQNHKKGRAEVSIDGLRLIAERTGDYQGQTPREWCHAVQDGQGGMRLTWYEVWPFDPHKVQPLAARVGIYRRGFVEPLHAVARFEAYKQTKWGGELNEMWSKMGPEQLGKCAEALGLRQAFPNELGGIYTTDEMGQADEPEAPPARQQRRPAQTTGRSSSGTSKQQASAPREWHPYAVKPGDTISGSPPALFPYGKYERVPLNAVMPGEDGVVGYVIPTAKLEAAEQQLSAKLREAQAADVRDTDREDQLVVWMGELADEMTRRAEEAEERAAIQASDQAPEPAAVEEPASQDEHPQDVAGGYQ